MRRELPDHAVAIVGMGCRLPGGADSPAGFWKLLCDGVDAITELPADRFDLDDIFDPDPERPGKIYSRWGGFVERIDAFDADFFGISPREARRMDPQHRLLLEVVWEAMEDGGVVPERISGTNTGVFIGISTHDYADMHVRPGFRNLLDAHINIGNALCAAANRISYLFDFHGPSFAIESACSSSLTAVHLACRSLQRDESEMAIAGGVNLVLAPELTIGFCKASMISPDGRCRAFDAGANGYVRSEGAGAVFLKPLDRALVDGDPIYAVIRGTAVNEDGRTAGISLPNGAAQERLLKQALRDAGIAADAVQYVEAHGTGTAAGDPIEAGALGRVFGAGRSAENPCLIGSAKTNVGHLEAAAGITGLIKAALALKHRQIPPSLHFDHPHPEIPFDDLRLKVPTKLEPWPAGGRPAVAGVNAFGFGGSNAHVILEEPPAISTNGRPTRGDTAHLLTISARTPEALTEYAARYVQHLGAEPDAPIHDICYTASRRRSHHEHRLAVVGRNRAEMIGHLDAFLRTGDHPDVVSGRVHRGDEPKLAFAFSGMGPQWWGMGRRLLAEEPVYRDALLECDRVLRPISGWSLLDEMGKDEAHTRVNYADVAHVANCAMQIALAELWRSWGVVPDAVVGHSSGEIAASYTAGALDLHDALYLAYHRGCLQHSLAGRGGMLAASLSADEAASAIAGFEDRVSLAAFNSPNSITFSGDVAVLEQLAADFERRGLFHRMVRVDVPYHAPQMGAIRDELLEVLRQLNPRVGSIPHVSTTTGGWLDGIAVDGDFWWRNVRDPVQFGSAVNLLLEDGCEIFLEIGPHPVLSAYLTDCLAYHDQPAVVLPTLRRMEDDRTIMLRTLGALHVRGREVKWPEVYGDGKCVPLPTYPWQRERFWFETPPDDASTRSAGIDTGHPLLGRRLSSPTPIWETDLADSRTDYLNDHCVQNSIVFPGAGYVEMMIAAAGQLFDDAPASLENIEFRKLLFLDEDRDLVLQLHYDPKDSSFDIHSAPPGKNADWTLHADSRLNRFVSVAGSATIDLGAVRQRCAREMPTAAHFQALEARGFHYGPAFQGLQEIRFGDGEAIARIGWPDGVNLRVDDHRVHPALLDAAFQVTAVAAALDRQNDRPSGPLFPVSINRVTFRAPAGPRFWAHIVVRDSEDAFLEGDVFLADDDGNVSLAFEGLRMKMVEEAPADRASHESDCLYELQWEASPLRESVPAARLSKSSADVRAAVESTRKRPDDEPDVSEYYHTVEPALDQIATGFALAALAELGWDAANDPGTPADALAEELGVVDVHRRLFAELLRILRTAHATSNEALQSAGQNGVSLHRRLDDLIADVPAYSAEAELLRRGGSRLADMLRGTVDVREVLLSGEALEIISQMYHSSPACRSYHTLLADVIGAALDGSSTAEPLRVIEIGAGTGAGTRAALSRMPEGAEYVFTDISPFFLAQAERDLAGHAGLRFSVLDIEKDPETQGFEPHSFDLVLASNVLHTTEDLRTSLTHARKLLAPGGMLVLLELSRRAVWLNLVFGLLDGWWRFTDLDIRPDYPLLNSGQWRSLAEEAGFEKTTTIFDGGQTGDALQSVVLAHAPDTVLPTDQAPEQDIPRTWLFLADQGGTAARTAESLSAHGDRCVLVHAGGSYSRNSEASFEIPPGEVSAISHLFDELRASGTEPDAVIHLWSLDGDSGEEITAADLMQAQRLGCESALALVQALDRTVGSRPEIWLVTGGSQSVVGNDALNVSHSALWGLGRVLANEHADIGCRLVDLGPEKAPEEIEALVAELTGDRSEEELAFRNRKRYLRRLRRVSPGTSSERRTRTLLSPETDAFSLEIDAPGALDSLYLRERPPAEPGPGEVAIRVRASGLNFREVLQSLDLLPPQAETVHSEGLGVECAGVIVSCGDGVDEFQPGDEVIALASPAHGSRAIAPAYLAVKKPDSLSFVEAATVMNAFVTAEYALNHVARIQPGERVLLHSASGAVGLAAIQICRDMGAEIFATAGTPEKRAHLESLGIEHVMDSRSLDFHDEVLHRTDGEGVDVVLNALTGEAMQRSLALLRPYGRFVELGKRDIYQNAQLGLQPFRRNLSYTALDLMQLATDRPAFANDILRQVVRKVSDGTWQVVPHTVFDLADAASAFRLMAQARHIGKIVLTVDEPRYEAAPLEERPLFRIDGTYLITGGLGGFGLAAAERLAEIGAGCLVLMSRSGTPRDDGDALERLRQSPARVEIVKGDVADERDIARAFDFIRRELPPLRGIIHGAMVLDDDVLVRLDLDRFRAVLAPKVGGAWNLHRHSLSDDLDFFVLFSSIASVIGHPMQGNYAAANSFLDAFAAHRRALGLPGLTIGWGAVSGVGYVSRHPDVAEYLERSGFGGFTPEEALDTFELLLRHDMSHVVAARLDWRVWAERNPVAAASGRFLPLMQAPGTSSDAAEPATDSPLETLKNAAPERRPEVLEKYLLQKVAKVLGAAPEKVDPERAFTELGFDSLMAVELITAFKVDLGVKLPVVKILQGTNARELAGTLLEHLNLDAETGPPVARTDETAGVEEEEDAGHPLSFEQRRFWLLDRFDPGNPAYNLPAAARITGRLDVKALERSLSEVMRRHEVLRAAFRDTDGVPVQVFTAAAPVALPVKDLGHLSVPERKAELHRQATEELRKPFDLRKGPLMRAALFRLSRNEHVILLAVHHIACDAWSMNMHVREMAALYNAYAEGRSAGLPDPPFRYADYVRRQHELLTDEFVETQLDYWKRELQGAPAGLQLPAVAAEKQAFRGGHQPFELSRELTEELQALSKREGVTLFMTLLAAFQTLLHRYSGNEDISVGTAISKRAQPGAEAVAGCFMNTVVLRSDLSGAPPFRAFLHRVRETVLGAFEHDEIPFDRIVEAVRPEREPGRTPLFQAMLVLHNAKLPKLEINDLSIEPVEVESGAAVTDIVLLADLDERLSGTLEFNTEILDTEAAERMLDHFETVLKGIVRNPDQPISELPLLTDPERRQALVEWNDTAVDFGDAHCVHELFEAQVALTPDAVAVICGKDRLTYRELDDRANRLAGHLALRGVGPDDVVGLCCEPSAERVAALLAILKAGGAYLPLDPADPPHRLHFMIRDANAKLVVAEQRSADLVSGSGTTVIRLGDEQIVDEPGAKPAATVTPADAAYVIYTSGSMGEPKGVVVPHAAIGNQVRARQALFPMDATDAVLQRTPVGFDPSVWEFLGPLSVGARIVVPDHREKDDLVRLISAHGVTTLQMVPSLLDVFLDDPRISECTSLRRIFCGGERLTVQLRDRVFARLPGVALHNMYGPAEAAIDATWWTCSDDDESDVVPIGRPMHNVRVYVLDGNRQPAPVGVPGELYIGGAGVARGYLNRPDLTADRFVPDPFGEAAGERMYRTGDLARRRSDGTLEFLGRVDDQVKIRGHRVEPGEIASVLTEHPSVREAVVIPRNDGRLAAFVATPDVDAVTAGALKEHAVARLPAHMVPSEIAIMERLPRLPGGKVDRRALAEAESIAPRDGRTYVRPRDPLEQQLAEIWEELLETGPVGVKDNFFDLGGHSLLAMRMISRIRQISGRDVPLASLVEDGTIEHLARVLRRDTGREPDSALVLLQSVGSEAPFFCVHPSTGSVMCYVQLARALGQDRPFYGVQSPALGSDRQPPARIEDMAEQYLEALRSIQPEGPYVLGGWSLGAIVAYEMACRLQADEVALLALMDPPSTAEPAVRIDDPDARLQTLLGSMGLPADQLDPGGDGFRDLEPDAQLEYVLDRARRAGLLDERVDVSQLRRQMQVHAAGMDALRRFRPRPFPGHVVLFESADANRSDYGNDWEELAEGGVTLMTVRGDHFSMLREPDVQQLAGQLKSLLADVRTHSPA